MNAVLREVSRNLEYRFTKISLVVRGANYDRLRSLISPIILSVFHFKDD